MVQDNSDGALAVPVDDPTFQAVVWLYTANEWRQRIVEQITPLSADHYRVATSIQVWLDHEMIDVEPDTSILLPVTWLPKEPLLNFGMSNSAGISLTVMPRRENAAVTARVLQQLQSEAELELFDFDTLSAISAASTSLWRQLRRRGSGDDVDALRSYLELGAGHSLMPATAAEILDTGRNVTRQAYNAAGLEGWWVIDDRDNPATNGALLAAYTDPPGDRDALIAWMKGHNERIAQLSDWASENPRPRRFLELLLRAGVRWPVITDQTYRVGAIHLYKLIETRPSGLAPVSRYLHDTDASLSRSYHLQVHIPHPSVVVRAVTAQKEPGVELGFPETFEDVRSTNELWTTYSGDEQLGRVQFTLRFGLRLDVWIAYMFAGLIAVAAIVALAWLPSVSADTAAVLTIPTSLAAAFVLGHEPPVAARYVLLPRIVVTCLSAAVWVWVLARMVSES